MFQTPLTAWHWISGLSCLVTTAKPTTPTTPKVMIATLLHQLWQSLMLSIPHNNWLHYSFIISVVTSQLMTSFINPQPDFLSQSSINGLVPTKHMLAEFTDCNANMRISAINYQVIVFASDRNFSCVAKNLQSFNIQNFVISLTVFFFLTLYLLIYQPCIIWVYQVYRKPILFIFWFNMKLNISVSTL